MVDGILTNGLQAGGTDRDKRQHVHLVERVHGDGLVHGVRDGTDVLVVADMLKAYSHGVAFNRTLRIGVILTDGNEGNGHVAAIFLRGAKGRAIGRKLWLGQMGPRGPMLGYQGEGEVTP